MSVSVLSVCSRLDGWWQPGQLRMHGMRYGSGALVDVVSTPLVVGGSHDRRDTPI
jgi:hypothetical protein